MKLLLLWFARWFFRFRAYNTEVLKAPGPVLLLPNHTSWLDWLFLGVCLDDDWKFVTSNETAQTSWLHRRMMIEGAVFRAAAQYLGKDPWDLGPDRFRYF